MLVTAMGLRGHRIPDHHHGMLTDLILAVLHHLVIVTLIVLLAVEFALLRPGLSSSDLRRLANVDAAYGAIAGLVIVVGICRVIWGAKGPDFYLSNPWFWAKMASFAAIGLLSIPPTLALLKWRKAMKHECRLPAAAGGGGAAAALPARRGRAFGVGGRFCGGDGALWCVLAALVPAATRRRPNPIP